MSGKWGSLVLKGEWVHQVVQHSWLVLGLAEHPANPVAMEEAQYR